MNSTNKHAPRRWRAVKRPGATVATPDGPAWQPGSDVGASQVVWRYLDFPRFISLLHTRSLFFARPDSFDDPFEGTLGPAGAASVSRRTGGAFSAQQVAKHAREMAYVSCWHLSPHESTAMWKLYSGHVAIRSTVGRLAKVIPSHLDGNVVYRGAVSYVRYDRDQIPTDNVFHTLFHKRLAYKHEREYRLVICNSSPPSPGVLVPVDLRALIMAVHVHPSAAAWVREAVESVCARYELTAPVRKSALDDPALI